ncbi:penicillin acylase family protein, partial [Bacillus sp. D-CC]
LKQPILRLFQMDLSRRQASGMLSEVVGEAAVDRDKLFRTLGLRRAAEASVSQYDGEAKYALQSFADGVNFSAPNIETPARANVAQSFAKTIIPPEFNGSNNWVISGEKSVSGKPILADDPHLSLATPSIWYQSKLEMKDLHVSGVIFAGVPGVILGHNDKIAWGVTNTGPDVQDLYIEK